MQFKSIIGQEEVKQRLRTSIRENRVAHTQLLLGPEGSGSLALAIACAQYINCSRRDALDSCGICPSCLKYEKYIHPDLHFFFPTTSNDAVKKDPRSQLFLKEWRQYLEVSKAYVSQEGWYAHLGVGNKQGTIYVRDASDLIEKMVLKSYESEYKVVIIWMPEKLHEAASNKLLKTLEEPSDKTLIFLVAERYELLLATVRSRAQLVKVNKLQTADIEAALRQYNSDISPQQARDISLLSNGNWNMALGFASGTEETVEDFLKFRQWLRYCFKPGDYLELNKFNADLSRIGREGQKRFLMYGLESVHNSILHNHQLGDQVKKGGDESDFAQKFAPYINSANHDEMYKLFNEAVYHIERNANANILFTDLSFKIIDLLRLGRNQLSHRT